MGKSYLVGLIVLAFCFSEPQVTIGLGKTTLQGAEFKYPANTFVLNFSHMTTSRLQFGLQYSATSGILNKRTFYNCNGLLFTSRIVLATQTTKSPYFGFNFGWLNSSIGSTKIIYNARGSFSGESVIGYTFRLDENSRFNLEYQKRYIELKYKDKPLQRSETLMASVSWLLIPALKEMNKPKELTPEISMNNKREYLTNKITYNKQQLEKYNTLLKKYDFQLENNDDSKLITERDYLNQQKEALEKENQELKKQLSEL